jgi:hypothetical protein
MECADAESAWFPLVMTEHVVNRSGLLAHFAVAPGVLEIGKPAVFVSGEQNID